MRCSNCGEAKQWQNVDFARIKPQGMCMCGNCGFISYPDKWKTKEEILKHYRASYRQPPTHFNIYAGQRKNNFHMAFLYELFEAWGKRGLTKPKILEIGSAFGYTLHWLKQMFPEAEITGTELTTSMRKVAKLEFGVQLDEDIDDTKKYDLIISYKVLEHQLDPDFELQRYQKMLTPEGRFYLSVPTWFDTLSNFGAGGFDLEYYYDPNHINVWTRPMVEAMVARCGFEIVKKDYVIYSSTYLLKQNDALKSVTPPYKEDPAKIIEQLEKVKMAYLAFTEGQHLQAIKIWPNYPTAHTQHIEMNRKKLAEIGWPEFKAQYIDPMLKDCVDSGIAEAYELAADYAMRAGALEEAVKYCEGSLKSKPENPGALHRMSNCMREMALRAKTEQEKVHYFGQALEVARHLRATSAQHFKEATDLIYLYMSHLPLAVSQTEAKNVVSMKDARKAQNNGPEITL